MAELACSMLPHHHLSPSAQEVPIMPASKGGDKDDTPMLGLPGLGWAT